MITLYANQGASGFQLEERYPLDTWARVRHNAVRLLTLRGHLSAASLLNDYDWELWSGTNDFNDEFDVLHARISLDRYVWEVDVIGLSPLSGEARRVANALRELKTYVRFITIEPDPEEEVAPVPPPSPQVISKAVERALNEANTLLASEGPSSSVDRVHTALHGYLIAKCKESGIKLEFNESVTGLYKLLRTQHPDFATGGVRDADIQRIVGALATVIDALNTIRNHASGAHPNEQVLGSAEAMLAINATRTILHYLDAKIVG